MKVRKYVIIQSRPTLETTQRPPLRKSHSYEKKYKIEKITFLFSLRYKNDMKLPKRHILQEVIVVIHIYYCAHVHFTLYNVRN